MAAANAPITMKEALTVSSHPPSISFRRTLFFSVYWYNL